MRHPNRQGQLNVDDPVESDAIVHMQRCCIKPNATATAVRFEVVPEKKGEQNLMVFGLYPPSKFIENPNCKAQCRTEGEMQQAFRDMKSFAQIAWIDLCVLSSDGKNADLCQVEMSHFSSNKEMLRFAHRDISSQLRNSNDGVVPVMYVAGRTCSTAFRELQKMHLLQEMQKVDEKFGVYRSHCEHSQKDFIAVVRPHPSHFLMTGRSPIETAIFNDTMLILSSCKGADKTFDQNSLRKRMRELDAERYALLEMRKNEQRWLTKRLYGNDYNRHGWFRDEHMHLRFLPLEDDNVKQSMENLLNTFSKEIVGIILRTSTLYKRLGDDLLQRLKFWFNELQAERFVTFMCNGVAARLGDVLFDEKLREWHDKLQAERFVTFMCDSVAARLGDVLFDEF